MQPHSLKRPALPHWAILIPLALLLALGAYLLWPHPSRPATLPGLDAARSLGPSNAPVTIIEYGDFGCTTCLGWERAGVLRQLRAAYGDAVRFVWRDFPVITAQSPKAAEAGLCAADQGKFWAYHDLLYAHAPALSPTDLKSYAAQAGMDSPKFDACLDTSRHKPDVALTEQDAFEHGFQGTPAFLVNGKPYAGPVSFDEFKGIIDPIVKK